MSDDYDTQPSLIDYARFHGLADNHLNQDTYTCLPSDLLPSSEDTSLPELEMPFVGKLPPGPKFRLDSKAASLLASSIKPPPALPWSDTLSDHRQVRKLKIERPVLKTHHENDMRKIRCRKLPKAAVDLAPIELDETEGLGCPPRLTGLATEWDKKVAEEKLQTTREVLKALQDTLRPVYTSEMHEAIIAEGLALTKRPRLEPISPPLLPYEAEQEPYVPSSPALHLQVMSDTSDRDDEQMRKVNEEISNQIRIGTENATPAAVGQIERLLRLAEHGPAPGELNTLDAHDQTTISKAHHPKLLKLEPPEVEPLIQLKAGLDPGDKPVARAYAAQNLFPELMQCEEPSPRDTDQPFKDDLLAQLAHEAAQAVHRDLADDKLEPADRVMRVEVPNLEDVKPAAPSTISTSRGLLRTMVENQLEHTRRSFDKAVERDMRWAPITSGLLGPPATEGIELSPQIDEWTSEPAFSTKSEDLLWRPDVLRILSISEEDDEEDLEIDSSLEDEPVQAPHPTLKRSAAPDAADSFFKREPRQLSVPGSELGTPAFGSLAGFMDTRKAYKKPRLERETKPTKTMAMPALDSEKNATGTIQVPATPTEGPFLDPAAFAAPQVPKITSAQSIIVNSTLLKSHRQLTQALETRPDPPLVIIYRDLENENDMADAPDIIVSPTTSAIFTSLQATTQRSLPGQGPSRPPIFNRIDHLSQLYDRLLVLATLPPANTSLFGSSPICHQISTLISFCTSLSSSTSDSDSLVRPILIPIPPPTPLEPTIPSNRATATPSPLYQWTYALICKHALNPTSTSTPYAGQLLTLLPEETLWELFLRKARLNPYAAQVVLSILRKPEQRQRIQKPALWGLSAIVQMGREERLRIFAGSIGRTAVERLSDVLDGSWGGSGSGSVREAGGGAGAGVLG